MTTYEAQLWYRMPDTSAGYKLTGLYTRETSVTFTGLINPPHITQEGDIITVRVASDVLVLHQDSFIGCTYHPEQKDHADNN